MLTAGPPSNTIVPLVSADDPRVAEARMLLLEYTDSLGVDLSFQNIDREISEFPGKYMPPDGALLLASHAGKLAGSVAMRRFDAEVCEMKRLYVRPDARGLGVGRALAVAVIQVARDSGYRTMRLDTLAGMDDAQGLYKALGFREIAAYYENPVPGSRYLELDLRLSK